MVDTLHFGASAPTAGEPRLRTMVGKALLYCEDGEGRQNRQPHAHFFAGAAAKIRSANGHNCAATSGSAP